MSKNFETYLDLKKGGLENKYVVIINGKIVVKGENIEKMLKDVKKKYPHTIPFVAKIPGREVLVLL